MFAKMAAYDNFSVEFRQLVKDFLLFGSFFVNNKDNLKDVKNTEYFRGQEKIIKLSDILDKINNNFLKFTKGKDFKNLN